MNSSRDFIVPSGAFRSLRSLHPVTRFTRDSRSRGRGRPRAPEGTMRSGRKSSRYPSRKGDRAEKAGVFVPKGAPKAWSGLKSGRKSSRYPTRKGDRAEKAGVFVPKGAPKAWSGLKSGRKSSRYPSRKGDRAKKAGVFVPKGAPN